ncbi:rRNA maturation RNase YbeY [Dokdonia sinensis]|uniref:Endoribonuclease YbeY n=1 Tax=Dokdonia sinensis TaxID=2479847 RepID=A0A3M0GNI1_9FLAO|nr:rRNA maturation RNase YbeY [Dokdonia sinensis]RMB63203.1 rRNA maturation RNase YbeY [Dokdonia sinensis]
MIEFHSENNFEFEESAFAKAWLEKVIAAEEKELGEINYIFCDDEYLHKINMDFLNHDTYTDIISFDYSQGAVLSGDIYVSTQRVEENAKTFKAAFKEEFFRVLVHGILHYCGYKDKTEDQAKEMRDKEDYYLNKAF